MIDIKLIGEEEAKQLNLNAKTAYWAQPIGLSLVVLAVSAICHWFFNTPWSIGWWVIGSLFFLYLAVQVITGRKPGIQPEMPKIVRRGKIINTRYQGNRPIAKVNLGQSVEITMEPSPIPDPYPQQHAFVVWRTLGMPYYRQDESLPQRYQQLVGQEVEIEYLTDTGAVLAFRQLNVSENPLRKGEQISVLFNTIQVTRDNGHNESIRWNEVDYIAVYSHSKQKPNTDFYLNLRSFSAMGISVSSDAAGFTAVERKLTKELPEFDMVHYDTVKSKIGEEARTVWVRRPVANAQLLDPTTLQASKDLTRGIYLEDRSTWMEWGTFRELEANKIATRTRTTYPNPNTRGYTYHIANITVFNIRIGKLITETPSWDVDRPFNPDWPVTAYRAEISLGKDGHTDFETLLTHFAQAWGVPNKLSDAASAADNGLSASWQFGNVSIKLDVPRLYQLDGLPPLCRMEINRKPDLSSFYETEYTKTVQLHAELQHVVIDGLLNVPDNYAYYPNVHYTPAALKQLLQSDGQLIAWLDHRYGFFGFGNAIFAQLIEFRYFKGLSLVGEYWRDHPRGLCVYLLDEKRGASVTSPLNYLGEIDTKGDENQWGEICKQLETFLPYPCIYREHREYY